MIIIIPSWRELILDNDKLRTVDLFNSFRDRSDLVWADSIFKALSMFILPSGCCPSEAASESYGIHCDFTSLMSPEIQFLSQRHNEIAYRSLFYLTLCSGLLRLYS